jgi:hypothetical protein
MNDVLPNGRHVQFDVEEYLEEFMVETPDVQREPAAPDMEDDMEDTMPDLPQDEMNLE